MNTKLMERAEQLAAQPYVTEILREELPDGATVFVAYHPELDGCVAQGDSVAAAKTELKSIQVKYILHLLEHGLPVPGPSITKETVSSGISYYAAVDFAASNTPEPSLQESPVESSRSSVQRNLYEYVSADGILRQVA